MTTIYELEKQATPGPLEVTETGEYGATFYELMVPDGESVCGFYAMPQSQDLDNAQLIAHCRNHFMEALKALKEEHEEAIQHRDDHDPEYCDTCKLIKKLETV